MNQNLKQIVCEPECGFMVRSHDSKEVMNLTKQHVNHAHPGLKVTEGELKRRMTIV